MTTPLENLYGIQKKFNDAVNPSEYLKAKPARPQVAPGAAATKVMLNKPGGASIKPPTPAGKGGLPIPSLPIVRGLGVYNLTQAQTPKNQFIAGMTVTNPIMGSVLGFMDQVQDYMSAFTGTQGAEFQGRGAGRAAFNPPKKKGLSTLQPGDDIPLSQYSAGVPTGKSGGGNAGGAQSINPDASGYIPPTGEPLSVGTDTSSGGREVVSDADEAMRIWAQTHGQLADRVIDKVENRGLQQAGYDVIKSVRQPGESAEFPVTMAGEKPEIPYSDDNKGVETLNRDGMEAFPVEMKAENSTSAFSPAFGAQNFLKDYMSGLKGKDSADFEVDILSTPAELQDPVVMPSSAASFEAPSLKSKLDPSQFESMSKNMPKRR